MFEKLKDRYNRYYITDPQLDRYVALGVLTAAQAEEIKASRGNGQNEETAAKDEATAATEV